MTLPVPTRAGLRNVVRVGDIYPLLRFMVIVQPNVLVVLLASVAVTNGGACVSSYSPRLLFIPTTRWFCCILVIIHGSPFSPTSRRFWSRRWLSSQLNSFFVFRTGGGLLLAALPPRQQAVRVASTSPLLSMFPYGASWELAKLFIGTS